MTIYPAAALPSLLSLGVISLLPWSCRRSHSLWRALQAYDKQPITITAVPPKPNVLLYAALIVFGIPSTLFILMVIVAVTSGGDWHNGWPIFASFRDSVPRLILLFFVYMATASLITSICKPILSAARVVGLEQTEAPVVINCENVEEASFVTRIFHNGRNTLAIKGILSVLVIWVAQSAYSHSAIILAMTSGCAVLVILLNHMPLTTLKYSSFRGFVLVPFACIAYQSVPILLGHLMAYIYLKHIESEDTPNTSAPSLDKPSSWGVGKMFEDVDASQSFFLVMSFIFSLAAWFTCAVVALAYRYDMTQAGRSSLSEEEADDLVLHSTQAADSSGRTPILLHEAAIHTSKLNTEQLPTFQAAYYTLFTIQVIGMAFDVFTGWQPGIFYPTKGEQLPLDGVPFSTNIWPVVAYPFVIIAMIMSVSGHPERNLRSLWSYHELWHLDPKSSVKSIDAESGEELLELGKNSGE